MNLTDYGDWSIVVPGDIQNKFITMGHLDYGSYKDYDGNLFHTRYILHIVNGYTKNKSYSSKLLTEPLPIKFIKPPSPPKAKRKLNNG